MFAVFGRFAVVFVFCVLGNRSGCAGVGSNVSRNGGEGNGSENYSDQCG